MTKFLLAVHVLAAIIAIGPVTVAASQFTAAARRASAAPGPEAGARRLAVVRTLHHVCRVYALVGVVVPVFGLATANAMHVLGSAWLIASIALTVLAAVVLGALVLPGQAAVVGALAGERPEAEGPARERTERTERTEHGEEHGEEDGPVAVIPRQALARLAMYTGVFNLLWAVVTVLMIVRPGSTTGA